MIAVPSNETGVDAGFSTLVLAGIRAAVAYVNSSGGINGQKVQISVQNMQSDPQGGVSVTQAMLEGGHYKALVPAAGADNGQEVNLAELATRQQILHIQVGGSPLLYEASKFPYSFWDNTTQEVYGTAFACMIKQAYHPTTVALVHNNDAFTDSELAYFPNVGIKVVDNELVTPTTLDYTAQIQRMQSTHPGVMVGELLGAANGGFLADLRAIHYTGNLAGGLDVTGVSPSLYLPGGNLALVPKNYVVMAPQGAVAVGGTLSPAQQALVNNLLPAKPVSGLSNYGFGWDGILLTRYAFEHSNGTTAGAAKALESLTGSTNLGTVGVTNATFNGTTHTYGTITYYQVDISKPVVNGTWSEVRPIPSSC